MKKYEKISDYNNKKLCECFDCFDMKNQNKDITQCNIELKDNTRGFNVVLERGKYLSYFDVRFAKVDNNGIIRVFKDYM